MKLRTIESKLPKSIKRIVILRAPQSATGTAAERIVVEEKKKKKKKQSKGMARIWERVTRRVARAHKRSAESYLDRHQRSNRKHRDGWLRDLRDNLSRANTKGTKVLKISKLLKW